MLKNNSDNDRTNKKLRPMRIISVEAIKGTEILMQDIFSNTGVILMSKGSKLKKEYKEHLMSLGIKYIYVEDELSQGILMDEMTERQIEDQCQDILRNTIEKYFYSGNAQLESLKNVAEDIISDVLKQQEVMFNIAGIRQNSEGIYSHSVNVCALSVLIALKMKLPRNKIKDIAVGSLLHDIGIKYIEGDIQKIHYTEWTKEQEKEIKKHVVYGYYSVENEEWISAVAKNIILSHHERLDGSGYPFHYTEERIKVGSKIVAVCDEFDRMVYGLYTPKLKVYEAIEAIVAQGGIKFDLKTVKIFNESVAAYPNGTSVLTNEGQTGIVLRQNNKFPTRPVIRILSDADGKTYNNTWIEKDLTKELSLFIQDTVENI